MYQINSNKVLFSQLGAEGVLYNKIDSTYFTLNETLVKIFKGIESLYSTNEIVLNLCQEYEINEQDCRIKIHEITQDLLQREFIILRSQAHELEIYK